MIILYPPELINNLMIKRNGKFTTQKFLQDKFLSVLQSNTSFFDDFRTCPLKKKWLPLS